MSYVMVKSACGCFVEWNGGHWQVAATSFLCDHKQGDQVDGAPPTRTAGSPLDRIEEWCRLRGEGEPVAADVWALVNVAKAAEAFGMGDSEWRRVEEALAELNQEQPT